MLQSRNDKGSVTVNRYDDKYKQLQQLCHKYGNSVQHLTKKLKVINDKEEQEESGEQFDLLFSVCLMDMLNIYQDKTELTNVLVDLSYCQKVKAPGINNLLWGCVGDIVVDNIVCNLGMPDYKRQTRTRTAYNCKNAVQALETVAVIKSKLDQQLESAKPVPIYQHDITVLQSIKNEKYRRVYFVLLCFCKAFENENKGLSHAVFLHRNKKSKMTASRIAKLAGHSVDGQTIDINAALNWLLKNNLIERDSTKTSTKKIIISNYDYNRCGDVAFYVSSVWNPILYYRSYFEDKAIYQCDICSKDYIKSSNNQKVCLSCKTKNLK